MRRLYIDIETSPHTAYVWGLNNENIGITQLISPTRIICVAYQFDGGPMRFVSEWKDGRESMIAALHDALDAADIVVHYNGTSFDEKHLNREFLQAGFSPPSGFETIDLYRAVKAKFRFAASKLAQVAKELELSDQKLKTDFELWSRVLNGEPKARKEMERYNKQDVVLLLDLYNALKPWIVRHPNMGLYEDDDAERCTRCGSTELQRRGVHRTSAGVFQRYQCQECGGWSRGSKRLSTTPLREG